MAAEGPPSTPSFETTQQGVDNRTEPTMASDHDALVRFKRGWSKDSRIQPSIIPLSFVD